MPHKNEMYDSFNEPYGETYCVDDGLWYDDDTEIFPEPLSKPIRPYNFSIISHLGEYYLEDKYGISEQNKEDLVDCMNWLKKKILVILMILCITFHFKYNLMMHLIIFNTNILYLGI